MIQNWSNIHKAAVVVLSAILKQNTTQTFHKTLNYKLQESDNHRGGGISHRPQQMSFQRFKVNIGKGVVGAGCLEAGNKPKHHPKVPCFLFEE